MAKSRTAMIVEEAYQQRKMKEVLTELYGWLKKAYPLMKDGTQIVFTNALEVRLPTTGVAIGKLSAWSFPFSLEHPEVQVKFSALLFNKLCYVYIDEQQRFLTLVTAPQVSTPPAPPEPLPNSPESELPPTDSLPTDSP